MLYQFAQHLLLRMPVKNPADYDANPQSFLNDHFFRAAIRVATSTFYIMLERKDFQAGSLTEKEANTLQKYINRYCFRPTPFGLFSSVTLSNWSAVNIPDTNRPFIAHFRAAMTVQHLLSAYASEQGLITAPKYESNPSIYRVLNEYRFFRTGLDETAKRREYQLQSIAFSKVLKDLITGCAKRCFFPDIVDRILRSAGCTRQEAEDYAYFLIDAQLLVNCSRPNIIGGDHLQYLSTQLVETQTKTDLIHALSMLDQKESQIEAALIGRMEEALGAIFPDGNMPQDKLNIILKKDIPIYSLKSLHQIHLREGLAALELLSPIGKSATMSQFINTFQQYFEGQTLPLLLALDPEAGIGYQHPETEKNNPLLETLNIPNKSQAEQTGSWSAAHSLLMESWLRDQSANTVIRLTDIDLEKLKTTTLSGQLLGMSVLFRIAGDKVFIENAGGINAPALLGRFTVVDDEIAKAAQQMSGHLEQANPEVIFAELGQLADPHTDNVNRRAHIYSYEIPITASSTLAPSHQIPLSDLYVRIVNNMAVLFSEIHQKIVIPRLTSAYNHSLNKLPLFRFLADLPYQYGRSSLGLDMRQFFPNLSFYPRVEYQHTILSLATWIVSGQELEALQNGDLEKSAQAFLRLSGSIRLPRRFVFAEGDQELVIDSLSDRDINLFCRSIRQKKEVILKEFFSQPEVRQYNAFLLPVEPLALPTWAAPVKVLPHGKRKFVPGSEWLYLKIYSPKIGVNRLLKRIRPLLSKIYNKHRITQWFFIRYEDHAPHIRLRLQINPESISYVLLAFKMKLDDRIQQQVIREFQIDIYNRELERYALGGIENTELFFSSSSKLVIAFLDSKTDQPTNTYAFALVSVQAIISFFITDPEEQINFTMESFEQFLPEFIDKPINIELDKKYRELKSSITEASNASGPGLLSGSKKAGTDFLKSLQNIQNEIKGDKGQAEYLRSIIHMHFNRIFTDESRKQEMICYYLIYKFLLSVKARNKKSN
jgi:thiopeptide-type bacteriocin biosynthesis protein